MCVYMYICYKSPTLLSSCTHKCPFIAATRTFVSRASGAPHNHPRIPFYYIIYCIYFFIIILLLYCHGSPHVIQFYLLRTLSARPFPRTTVYTLVFVPTDFVDCIIRSGNVFFPAPESFPATRTTTELLFIYFFLFTLQVIMGDRPAAERACKEPNPIIDGRKANVNLAILGAKPRGNLQPGKVEYRNLSLREVLAGGDVDDG